MNNEKNEKLDEIVSQFEQDLDIVQTDEELENLADFIGLEPGELTSKKNKPLIGISLAILLGILSAIIWATITQLTGFSVGYAAIGVGFMVSLGFSIAGKGTNSRMGIISGAIAFFSILLGESLSLLIELSNYWEVSLFETIVTVNYFEIFKYLFESIGAIDILFYILAISTAYKYSFLKIDDGEFVTNPIT